MPFMEDTLYPLMRFYKNLPSGIKDVVGRAYCMLPRRLRYGSFYDDYLNRISMFIMSDADMLRRLQMTLLCATVNRAVASVPFYADFERIDKLDEFKHFPIITKKDILDNASAFVSRDFFTKRLKANTGGSSGTPMEFFLHAGKTRPKECAHFDWFWGQNGYAPGSRVLMIRGASLKGNALYEYQSIKNCLAVSCYEVNGSNIEDVLNAVRHFRPEFIHGYPSAVKNFVQCIAENNNAQLNMPLRGLFLGSEGLTTTDRTELEQFFKARILTWYGHSECAIMGGNSLDSNELFFFPFYGYIELLDEDGKPIHTPGASGRIIATSFDNYVMPFIRYDTGDYGTLSSTKELNGMHCLVLSQIDGRAQDVIYLSDGTRVSLTAFIFGQHLPEFSCIREMQLVQSVCGRLTLRIVRGAGFTNADAPKMISRLQRSVSHKIAIECEFVDRIEKTHRGKHRFLVQTCRGLATECTNSPKS